MIEPALPLDFTQPKPKKEKPSVYEAVRMLRTAGYTVYRQGSSHSIDGKIASDAQIVAMAEALPR